MWPQPDTLRLHLRERCPPTPPQTTTTTTTTTTATTSTRGVAPGCVASGCVATGSVATGCAAPSCLVPHGVATTSGSTCPAAKTTSTVTTTCAASSARSPAAKTTAATLSTATCTSASKTNATVHSSTNNPMHSHSSPLFRLTPPSHIPSLSTNTSPSSTRAAAASSNTNTNPNNSTTTTRTAASITNTSTRSVANTTTANNAVTTTSSSAGRPSNTTTITAATHLSPWTGATTFASSAGHKKNSPNADSRLVVLGAPAVGKSALVVRLLTGRFIWEYDPTLEASYRHHTTVDDDPAVMDILDTAGQEEGTGVNEAHARWGDGFLLTFSLTDRRSFSTIAAIHATLSAAKQTPNFSCVIVANKTDLGHLAEVNEDEASELAAELGASLFLTSACDGGPAIHAAFSELHRDVVRRRWTRRRRSSAKTVIEGFYKMFSR
ncbi:uncharacterized protein [Panulirus ornatus]|uniref:uncharacterized protein n=1 Tax=Panulirus ornatus TaxID=150431 RepID=UPI003A8A0753